MAISGAAIAFAMGTIANIRKDINSLTAFLATGNFISKKGERTREKRKEKITET